MFHYRKSFKKYESFPRAKHCSFCEEDMTPRIIRETEYAYVVPNRVAYDLWEMREVTDHLLIIPKQHVASLSELSPEAQIDIMKLYGEYEDQNFNVYARGRDASARTVAGHQHTHLIRTKQERVRAQLAVVKPRMLLKI